MESNMNISKELKKLLKGMRWRKVCLYFGRNHIRHTSYYYNKFIEIIGLDTWENLDSYYKHEWNSARNSFDRMNGLIAAWRDMDSFPLKNQEDEIEKKLSILSEKIEELSKKTKLEEKLEALTNEISELVKSNKKENQTKDKGEISTNRTELTVLLKEEKRSDSGEQSTVASEK